MATRLDQTQKEQETVRLALMGDAVAVAASAVFFAVRLVDATFDLHVSSALYGKDIEASRESAAKYQTFLSFKASEELRSMAMSLVLPLLLMRVLGAVKDIVYSLHLGEGNSARKVLDATDACVLILTGFYSLLTIPPLESKLRSLDVRGMTWEYKQVLDTFDSLEISHLFALAQAGLLMLLSLLKLSARLERSSTKILERASEMDSMEAMFGDRVRKMEAERSRLEAPLASLKISEPQQRNIADSDSTSSSLSTQEESALRQLPAAAIEASDTEYILADDIHQPLVTELGGENDEFQLNTNMESEKFYKERGWRKVTVPGIILEQEKQIIPMHDHNTAADVLLGLGVSVATFFTVQRLHDPVVKLFTS